MVLSSLEAGVLDEDPTTAEDPSDFVDVAGGELGDASNSVDDPCGVTVGSFVSGSFRGCF
jgi:hypothetical protein